MKTVLCFGDSNTWGWNPGFGERYSLHQRWTTILQDLLGTGFQVIAEGQNGRTTVHDDPVEGHKNGLAYLHPCLESHRPVDLAVIMLGTNDLKHRFGKGPAETAKSVGRLVDLVLHCNYGPGATHPEVLLVAPPPLGALSDFAEIFSGGREKSLRLAECYRLEAEARSVPFLDAGRFVKSSSVDGVHLDADQLPGLAEAIAEAVTRIFS